MHGIDPSISPLGSQGPAVGVSNVKHNPSCKWWNKSIPTSTLPVALSFSGCEGGEAWHEEMKHRERHHVHCQLLEVSGQLVGEPGVGG